MSGDMDTQRSEADAELEREVRKGRKFTLAEAVGRMAGPGAMKGVSPVTRQQQAEAEIEEWLRRHLPAGEGELQVVLLRRVKVSELLLNSRPSLTPRVGCEFAISAQGGRTLRRPRSLVHLVAGFKCVRMNAAAFS
jgi:hypothetical protein